MKRFLFVFACASLLVIGCGKDDKGGDDKGGDDKAATTGDDKGGDDKGGAAAGGGPEIDCAAFAKKMNECVDTFAPLYSKTEIGSKAGKGTDGEVDHDKAAERFKMLWDMAGEQLCNGGDAVMDTPYKNRDKRWKERFVKCDSSASCDDWAPCMATAVGELLPAR